MLRSLALPTFLAMAAALQPYTRPHGIPESPRGGKGFGGGEATRDPTPTQLNPNDPRGKQCAIYKAETFAEYYARRQAGFVAPPNSEPGLVRSAIVADSKAAKAAWLTKLGDRGQWGHARSDDRCKAEPDGSGLFDQYITKRRV